MLLVNDLRRIKVINILRSPSPANYDANSVKRSNSYWSCSKQIVNWPKKGRFWDPALMLRQREKHIRQWHLHFTCLLQQTQRLQCLWR